ncbi:MAG: hypothetical protein Q8Q33_03125, partial [Chlamydiota bacterium]|nr:hypothetical protein [Chlamydiota bacterium]
MQYTVRQRINMVMAVFFVIAIAFSSFTTISAHDILWHLKSGQWIVEHARVPLYDVFSYTASQTLWIDHTWLFQIMMYAIYLLFNFMGLILFKIAVVLVMYGSILLFLHKKNALRFDLLLLSYLIVQERIQVRPEILSFLFIILFLIVLENYQTQCQRTYWLYTLPLMQCIWSNMEGLFMLGPALILFYLFDRHPNRLKLFVVFILTILCCFITPYHWHSIVFAFQLLMEMISYLFLSKAPVGELLSTFSSNTPWRMMHSLYLLLLLICSIVFWKHRKTFKKSHQLTLAAFFILSVLAQRNIALLALSSPLLLSAYTENHDKEKSVLFFIRTFLVLTALTLLIYCSYTSLLYSKNGEYKRWGKGIAPEIYPEQAITDLLSKYDHGHIFNDMDFGPALIFMGSPQIKVFIDPRTQIYRGDIQNLYQNIFYQDKILHKTIDDFNIRYIMLSSYNKASLNLISSLSKDPNWHLTYTDGYATLFIKAPIPETLSWSKIIHMPNGPTEKSLHTYQYLSRVMIALEHYTEAKNILLK